MTIAIAPVLLVFLFAQRSLVTGHAGGRDQGVSGGTSLTANRESKDRFEPMATVTCDQITRVYPKSAKPAVDRLNLEVRDGEFLVLVGPSGCGKTTSAADAGGAGARGRGRDPGSTAVNVVKLAPRDRDIAMVFQNYALYPHMNVAQNMGFALRTAQGPEE